MSIESRRERRDFKNFVPSNEEEVKYEQAFKRVKRIKGFYVHFLVYLLVNASIICGNYFGNHRSENEIFWSWETFSTAFFWGIGLLAHGMSIFGRNIFFGDNWEERKIQELIEKENKEKWE
ncbi:MAG: 2TM domain-containing protein [Flavobacterium sp.]|uniref:2TM domain-containing protein n=1 Tax=Flavobacterium sp. TaxID=239 RepID=UPI003263E557